MLDWHFMQTKTSVWLGTAFNTRAEQFLRQTCWTEVCTHGDMEIKFETSYDNWQQNNN